ncbi:hypothetical protein MMC34_001919 [Xylographa carneopallida]|nr:hypothetical protein [Xylographa carneopallida]
MVYIRKIWDTYTGECLNTLQHEHIVRAVAFPQVANPNLIATGGFEKKLRIWDMNRTESQPSSNSSSPTISLENSGGPSLSHSEMGSGAFGGVIKSIVWGADYNLVITASDDKAVRWWDLRSRTPITKADLEGELGTCEMNTTPSSYKSVLSVASGKNAYFFEGQTPGQLLKKVTTQHDIASLAFNLDERKFVVGGKNDTYVRVYDFDQEKELDVYKGHHGPIWSTNFSPTGKLYATGSEDGTMKMWKFCDTPYGLWK